MSAINLHFLPNLLLLSFFKVSKLYLLSPLLIALLLVSTLVAKAQSGKGTISGIIVSQSNEPLPGISIYLEDTGIGATTNADGSFILKNIPPASYTLTARGIGYSASKQNVTVNAGKSITLNLQLNASAQSLSEVVVTGGTVNKFADKESKYVARMPLSNLENPQVYNVVTKELMQEQLVVDFKSAFKSLPGVPTNGANHGSNGRYFTVLRGFNAANTVRNGVVSASVSEIDPVNIERLEAIKGPSGTLYGASLSGFGGLLNRVTKKALNTFKGDASYTAGQFGLNRLTLDLNAPLGKTEKVFMRINAAAHSERSFQDVGNYKTYTLAPTFTFEPNEKLTIHLDAEFYNRKGTTAFGNSVNFAKVSAKRADELKLDYNRAYTANSILANTETSNFYGQINYKLSNQWLSQTNLSYAAVQFDYPAVNVNTLNDSLLSRTVFFQYTNQLSNQIQQNFIGDFKIWNLRNRVVAGLDVQYGKFDFPYRKRVVFDTLNYLNPGKKYDALNINDVSQKLEGLPNLGTRSGSSTIGAYISDVVNLSDQLSVMASIRYDKFDSDGNYDYLTGLTTGNFKQEAFSPKFGIVYQPVKDQISVFANYMNGFQFLNGIDFAGNSFKPQYVNQVETGVKLELFNRKLSSTLSYYDISLTNSTRTDPVNAGFSIQDGTQKSKGFEADLIINPFRGFNLVAGYAYNDSKLTKANPTVEGRRPSGSGAYHVANAWLSYRISSGKLNGLGIGSGVNYSGEQFIVNSTTSQFVLPEYTTLDGTLFYDTNSFRIGFKADNMTNTRYFSQFYIAPQALARYSANIIVKF